MKSVRPIPAMVALILSAALAGQARRVTGPDASAPPALPSFSEAGSAEACFSHPACGRRGNGEAWQSQAPIVPMGKCGKNC